MGQFFLRGYDARGTHASGEYWAVRSLALIALIEDPAVIARVLRHLGLPTDIPEAQPARAPPLHLVVDAPPTDVAGDEILFDEPA